MTPEKRPPKKKTVKRSTSEGKRSSPSKKAKASKPKAKKQQGPGIAKSLLALIASVATGCMVFLSFPNYDHFYLLWFAMVPLMWATEKATPKRAFWLGLLAGAITNIGGFHWITGMLQEFGHMSIWTAAPTFGLLAVYQGLTFAIWAWLSNLVATRTKVPYVVASPLIYTAVEFLLPFVFPWYMGNGQYLFTHVTQIVDILGVSGLTSLIILVNATLYIVSRRLLERKGLPKLALAVTSALFALTLVYGHLRLAWIDNLSEQAQSLRIGIVEADIGIWEKEAKHLSPQDRVLTLYANLIKHQEMSATLEAAGADLIVWPETSYFPVRETHVKVTDSFAISYGKGMGIWLMDHEGTWHREDLNHLAQSLPGELVIKDAWVNQENDVYLVGTGGTVLHYNGKTITTVPTSTTEDLYAVDGVTVKKAGGGAETIVYVGGRKGTVIKIAGGVQTAIKGLPTIGIRDLEVFDKDGFVAACTMGFLVSYDDGIVTQHSLGGGILTSTLVLDDGSVVVAGHGGRIERAAKGSWHKVEVPATMGDVTALVQTGATSFVAVGDGGVVASYTKSILTDSHEVPGAPSLIGVDLLDDGRLVATASSGEVWLINEGEAAVKEPQASISGATLEGVRALGFFPSYIIPHDVKWVRKSPQPLPLDAPFPDNIYADLQTPWQDRNAVHRGFDTAILFGTITKAPSNPLDPTSAEDKFNTALLLGPDGKVLGSYDKNYLLVFGEYIPFGDTFPVLYDWLPEASHLQAGTDVSPLPLKGWDVGVMICYEDILPGFTRRLAGQSPNVIINVTNDAWFGKTAEPALHLALASFRAIENRLWVLRSTNTGISVFIDAAGRYVSKTDIYGAETLIHDVPMLETSTIYQQIGDVWAYGSLAAMLLFLILAMARRKSPRSAT